MNITERNEKIFQAAIGCTTAAVEFLRAVNKPLNATFIANTAWEIAKKIEELMETNMERDEKAATSGVAGNYKPQSSVDFSPVKAPVHAKPPAGLTVSDDDDLVPLK